MERGDDRGKAREGKNEGGKNQDHFGGLDDTGGLGAPDPRGKSNTPRTREPKDIGGARRHEGDPGTYEDANVTSADMKPETPGRSDVAKPKGQTGPKGQAGSPRHRDTNQEAGQDEDPGDRAPL